MVNNASSHPQLRAITDTDLPFLLQVYISTRLEELRASGLSPEQQLLFLQSQFQLQHRHYQQHFRLAQFQIVSVNGQDAGRLYYGWEGEDLRLIDIAILPVHRHRGIGTILIKELMRQAAAHAGSLVLRVEMNNPARDWYIKLGFIAGIHDGLYQQMQWREVGASKTN
jgi:ribosomal protein S18 acetylase RimI-like enzyme